MLKQPKGLIAAALANTGERFGFYTMMAILTLFLMSKFGIDGEQAGKIYSFFYTSIYILALVGGLIADRLRNYKGTITAGIVIMTLGYAVLMVSSTTTSNTPSCATRASRFSTCSSTSAPWSPPSLP